MKGEQLELFGAKPLTYGEARDALSSEGLLFKSSETHPGAIGNAQEALKALASRPGDLEKALELIRARNGMPAAAELRKAFKNRAGIEPLVRGLQYTHAERVKQLAAFGKNPGVTEFVRRITEHLLKEHALAEYAERGGVKPRKIGGYSDLGRKLAQGGIINLFYHLNLSPEALSARAGELAGIIGTNGRVRHEGKVLTLSETRLRGALKAAIPRLGLTTRSQNYWRHRIIDAQYLPRPRK